MSEHYPLGNLTDEERLREWAKEESKVQEPLEEWAEEVQQLHHRLQNAVVIDDQNVSQVTDHALKRDLARFMFKVASAVEPDEVDFRRICYLLAGFGKYWYSDDLDEVTSIAGDLELHEEHVPGDIPKMFRRMKKVLKKYVS